MSFTNKLLEYSNTQSGSLVLNENAMPVTSVTDISGMRKLIPSSQSNSIIKALATSVYTPSSQYNNALSNGTQVDFLIKLSTILDKAYDIAIHFILQNDQVSDVVLTPIFDWLNRVEFKLNSSVIQQYYSSDLFAYIWIFYNQEWQRLSTLFGMTDNYLPELEPIAPGTTREFILLLPTNFLRQTNIHGPSCNSEMQLRLYFNPPQDILYSGPAVPQIQNMFAEIITAHQRLSDVKKVFDIYRSGMFETRYSWLVNQIYSITNVQPSTRYEFLMSTFTGLCNYVQFMLGPNNAQGIERQTTYKIDAFDILDENGLSYFNNNSLQSDSESLIWDSYIVQPLSSFDETHNVYKYPFSLTPRNDLISGTLGGFQYLNGRSRLVIQTAPLAVAKIVRIAQTGVPAAGAARIIYTYFGESYYTPYFAFNESALNLATLIENLPPFLKYGQQVVVSAQFSAGVNVNITYDINQGLAFDELDKDALFILDVNRDWATGGAVTINSNSSIFQEAIDGSPTGDLQLTIMGAMIQYLTVDQGGSVRIRSS